MPKATLKSIVKAEISSKTNNKYVVVITYLVKPNGKETELSRYFPNAVALDLLEQYGLYQEEEQNTEIA